MTIEKIPGYCPQCVSRCGCLNVVEDGRLLRVKPDPNHPTGKVLCVKGKAAPAIVHNEKRFLYPLRRTAPKGSDPGWKRVSWEEALDLTAERMRQAARVSGPESVAFSITTRSGTSILDSFSWILRLANAFGTPNSLISTENCNWHKDFTTALTFGAGTGMPEFDKTGTIVLWGFNPAITWQAFAYEVREARKRGARLMVIDPRKSGLAANSDLWLGLRPGTDGALALAIAGTLIKEGRFDKDFMTKWTNGPFLVRNDNGRFLTGADIKGSGPKDRYVVWDGAAKKPYIHDPRDNAYPAGISPALSGEYTIDTADGKVICGTAFGLYAELCASYTPERAESITGISEEDIRKAAGLFYERPVSWFGWTGICQHTNSTQMTRAISLLYALTGCLDSPGGNVYFAKPKLNDVSGAELLSDDQKKKTLGLKDRPLGPARFGWIIGEDLYKAVLDKDPYPVKAMLGFGQNILLTQPGPERCVKTLKALDFYVHADMFMNPTAYYADIILPAASPWEREGFCAGFQTGQRADAHLQIRRQAVPAMGEARSDIWMVFELAKRLGLTKDFFGGGMDAGLEYMLGPSGVTLDELRSRPEGMTLKLTTTYGKHLKNGFATPTKKIEVYSERMLDAGGPPLPEFAGPIVSPRQPGLKDFPFVLTTAKTLAFCHSQHRMAPELLKITPEPLVEINPGSALEKGIADGDWVRVKTPDGSIVARVKLNSSLAPRTICAQYGWWNAADGHEKDGMEFDFVRLIGSGFFDPVSGSSAFRSYACDVEKAANTSSPLAGDD